MKMLRPLPRNFGRVVGRRGTATTGAPDHEAGGRGGWWRTLKWAPVPTSLIMAYLGLQHFGHVREREVTKNTGHLPSPASEAPLPPWAVMLYRSLPDRVLSRAWGAINEVYLPVFMREPLLGLYVRAFGCNMSEAAESGLSQFDHLQALFTRRLRAGARPVDPVASLVSPADCAVLHVGRIDAAGRVEQVKGVSYSVAALLGTPLPPAQPGNTHFHCILYLAPGDYHHYHSPAHWHGSMVRHFPGDLMSVSPVVARAVPSLFALNERLALLGAWEHGFFSFVAVGAYNVGSIALDVLPKLRTNLPLESTADPYYDEYRVQAALDKGEHVGGFKLGSSIVLVFEAPENAEFIVQSGQKLKMGQPLFVVPHLQAPATPFIAP